MKVGMLLTKVVPQNFWGDPDIQKQYPLHTRVARSYYPALLHEATSERSFSDCGRQLGDLRRNMDKEVVCAGVRIATGERITKIPFTESMPFYKSRKRNKPAVSVDGQANLSDDETEYSGPSLPPALPGMSGTIT